MAESVRVNLSVPRSVDAVLNELAAVTGRSKASLIMEAVGYQLPAWQRFLDRARTGMIAPTRDGSEYVYTAQDSSGDYGVLFRQRTDDISGDSRTQLTSYAPG